MVIFIGNYSQANNALVIPVVGCGVLSFNVCLFLFAEGLFLYLLAYRYWLWYRCCLL